MPVVLTGHAIDVSEWNKQAGRVNALRFGTAHQVDVVKSIHAANLEFVKQVNLRVIQNNKPA